MKNEALTAAFKAGYDAAKRERGISGRFAYKGTAQTFWLAGHEKGEKEVAAYYASPEYAAAEKARWEPMLHLCRELEAIRSR